MADFQYKGQGLRNVGAYQAAGWPWVTGSAALGAGKVHMIEFPMVTRAVTVINPNGADEDIRVHFQSGSATAVTQVGEDGEQTSAAADDVILKKHFITIPGDDGSMTFNVKVRKIYISNGGASALSYEVFAELTGIPTGSYPHLSGSGITAYHGTEGYLTPRDPNV